MSGGLREFARAKVNLTLHVTGRRADGYRLLDSLVVFPEIGDAVAAEPAQVGLTLSVSGPFATELAGQDNLVLRAARDLGQGLAARITLEKRLPVASGIGGGSADAAAALRVLSRLWGVPVDLSLALSLGADVPVCMGSVSSRMQGVGEELTPVPGLPGFWLVLANRGVGVATGAVFAAMERDDLVPMGDVPVFAAPEELADWLRTCRNDMQAAALKVEPGIGAVLEALGAQNGCLLARMSGSGGTCFGLFRDQVSAESSLLGLRRAHSDWWIEAAPVAAGSRHS